MREYLRIGKIVRPHGIKGAVKLETLTTDNSRFDTLSDAFIEENGMYRAVKVMPVSHTADSAIVMIDGVYDRNTSESLRGKFICVDREHAARLPDGRYFIEDLIGCEVTDSDGTYLGKLRDVMVRPANDVYEIRKENTTLLVPALKKLLVSVDVAEKKIVFDKAVLSEVGLFENDEDDPE